MSVAFFDLDKTLIADNSARLWLRTQWHHGELTWSQLIKASYWLAKYHLGFTKLDNIVEKSMAILEGESQSHVLKRTEEFFSKTIKNIYRPGALAALERHRRLGQKVALLTSTFDGLSSLVQKDLGFDFCLCTKLEVDKDYYYTGKIVGLPCFGKNKIIFADALCKELNVSLSKCTFYSDSATDIPLLNMVGRPVAVNPDPHLRARAQLKKWPIVDWGKPAWIATI